MDSDMYFNEAVAYVDGRYPDVDRNQRRRIAHAYIDGAIRATVWRRIFPDNSATPEQRVSALEKLRASLPAILANERDGTCRMVSDASGLAGMDASGAHPYEFEFTHYLRTEVPF